MQNIKIRDLYKKVDINVHSNLYTIPFVEQLADV